MPGFSEKDTTEQVTYDKKQEAEKIIIERDDTLEGVPIKIKVDFLLNKDGEIRRITKRVPQDLIDANWASGTKMFKTWLFNMIDVAE